MDPSSLQASYGVTFHSNPISVSLCLLFFFLILLKLFRGKHTNLPPSPPQLPIIGNLHQIGSLPHRSLAALSQKYGPLMFLKLGRTPTLVVSSAKLAREVMKSHDVIFSNRTQNTAANLLLYGCHDVAYSQYGEHWRQARKLCVLELLSAKRVAEFKRVREEEVAVLIAKIGKACVNGGHVNVNELLLSNSNNIISRCALGDKFVDENGKSRFGDETRRVMVQLTAFCIADYFPVLRWVDVFRGFIGELKSTFKTMDTFFDRVIEEHEAKSRANDEKDFVDILLELQQDDKVDYHFTKDDVKAILLDMFVGGTDTTATNLGWTMTQLMRNPPTMKKVQEEVRRIVGKKQKIETKDIEKMEYMNCVIKESLRLHPPTPLLLPRETSETVNLESYQIPSKTSVLINAWAIQRDPKIWKSPNEFIPERFLKNTVDFKGQDYEFIPFGSGRRKCPGMSFALASLEYTLANLLYWFDWVLPNNIAGNLDMSEEHGLTVSKKVPILLRPIPYLM